MVYFFYFYKTLELSLFKYTHNLIEIIVDDGPMTKWSPCAFEKPENLRGTL